MKHVERWFHVLSLLSRMPQLSQSVEFSSPNFPAFALRDSLMKCLMNENVFYVILHNIIVFNKQISVSLHSIVELKSLNLSQVLVVYTLIVKDYLLTLMGHSHTIHGFIQPIFGINLDYAVN